jgi:hypothetical protein
MVETISPVVYGTRARWFGAVALHALGAAATAAAFGAVVAGAASRLGAPWGLAGAVLVAIVAALYAGREVLGLRIPVPQLRRQVPDWWRTYFGRPLAAALYGAGLGIGFLTFLGHGTLAVVVVGAAATGRPLLGALILAPFGLARGLAPLTAIRAADAEDGRRLVDRLSGMDDGVRSLANGLAIVVAGAAVLMGSRSTSGGWGEAAGAVVAVTFGWAAVAKLARLGRWRRALAAHRLPRRTEPFLVWAVPAAELAVPTLLLAGRARGAATLALVTLAVFTAALARASFRGGRQVPCGCFGREAVDVRGALARNALLGGLALAALVSAPVDPPLSAPAGADLLPALLATGALVAAAVTARRAAVWFSRGHG